MTYRGIDANQTAQGNIIVCSATHIIKSRTWMYVYMDVVEVELANVSLGSEAADPHPVPKRPNTVRKRHSLSTRGCLSCSKTRRSRQAICTHTFGQFLPLMGDKRTACPYSVSDNQL